MIFNMNKKEKVLIDFDREAIVDVVDDDGQQISRDAVDES